MPPSVARHPVDEAAFATVYADLVDKMPARLARRPLTGHAAAMLRVMYESMFGYAAVLAPSSETQHRAGRLIAQLTAAQCASAAGLDGAFPIGDERVPIGAPHRRPTAAQVVEAQYLAWIYDDRATLELLTRMTRRVLQAADGGTPAFLLRWKSALDALVNFPEAALDDTREAIALLDEATDVAPWVPAFRRSELAVFEAILEGDRSAADDRLVAHLGVHRARWSPDQGQQPQGMVSLAGSAAVAIAASRGMTLTVDSPYLIRP